MGCHIFCVDCHGEDGATSLWNSIDSMISKTLPRSSGSKTVWSDNARFLGFADAKILDSVKDTWKRIGK